MASSAREIEDFVNSRTVLELELRGSKGFNDDFLDFRIENDSEGLGILEFDIFLREGVDFKSGWAEFILVLQHERSNWDAFPARDLRKLQRCAWCRQSYSLPEGIGRIRFAKLVLNSEYEIFGRVIISRPILREPACLRRRPEDTEMAGSMIEVLLRNRIPPPPTRRLNELADLEFLAGKLPEIKALRVGSILPEEEAILKELPNFKSIQYVERGSGRTEDETYLVLPRLEQENRVFDLILINPVDRFELVLTESYHAFLLLAINGLLVIHDAQLPAANKVVRFLQTNRNVEFPALTPADSSNAMFVRKLLKSPRPWDHFEVF